MADRFFQVKFPQNNLVTNIGSGPFMGNPRNIGVEALIAMVTEYIKANTEELIPDKAQKQPSVSQSEEETVSNTVQSQFESVVEDQTKGVAAVVPEGDPVDYPGLLQHIKAGLQNMVDLIELYTE